MSFPPSRLCVRRLVSVAVTERRRKRIGISLASLTFPTALALRMNGDGDRAKDQPIRVVSMGFRAEKHQCQSQERSSGLGKSMHKTYARCLRLRQKAAVKGSGVDC